MSNIKAAFFDFDWTLFDHKSRSLVESAIESIKTIKEKGIKVFINSARSYFSLASLNTFEKIDFDGFVVSNGGACMLKDKVLYAHFLDKNVVKNVRKICDENNISYLLSTTKNTFIKINENKENVDKFYSVFYEGYPQDIENLNEDQIVCLQVFATEKDDHLFKEIKGARPFRFFESCFEYTAKEFVKSEGINAIIKEYGFNTDEICAFGDDLNDIDMFKLVKYGICMGNGKDEAKKHAYHVTSNIEDDGIQNGLKFLGLID